jgi:hypothetical protein
MRRVGRGNAWQAEACTLHGFHKGIQVSQARYGHECVMEEWGLLIEVHVDESKPRVGGAKPPSSSRLMRLLSRTKLVARALLSPGVAQCSKLFAGSI